ncbi:chorismate mutase / prephenate dehydrogenase [Pseudobacteriovorax antillogorgiicola]|uniref:chorismate mutase n=1 Tax=Pseudobacteriovorax antillogorgiicola TaxID=1513793 RepID=A0A1Y6CAR6_9BACT|nr:chorismate mutase/prephenate dehydrogenase [Pseudobacteriovorax antillogorgiicola]SMF54749.1 chorismate mutase / prephenate dehydrogenase [Pseudobacteriovorax antillogorgiicola]
MDDLNQLRQSIRDIDAQILELTSERMNLCRQVGEYKRANNLPVKDYKVEKVILDRTRQQARDAGIEPDLAVSIMKNLIKYSVLEQDEIKSMMLAQGSSKAVKQVLLIGGSGNMGQWMAHFFEALGHDVQLFDRSRLSKTRYNYVESLDDGLAWAEMIILATPMESTNEILLDLCKRSIKAPIIELTSLKSPIMSGLNLANQTGLDVVSIHPMFGPDVKILSGRNIIICDGPKRSESVDVVEAMFRQTSANIIKMPLEKHDTFMSYVLGSAHMLNLLYANVLESSGIPFQDLEDVAGTTFAHQVGVTKNVVFENQDLYFDIQRLNLETDQLFESFKSQIHLMENSIRQNRRSDFKEAMKKSADYFRQN